MNTNKAFLDILDAKTKGEILGSIADHYGTDRETIYNEVTSTHAEHLLEYMVEPMRSAASALMQRYGVGIGSTR